MNPDAEDRSIEMDEQDLHDTPSDNPASPPPDVHGASAASVSGAVAGGSADKKAVIRGARCVRVLSQPPMSSVPHYYSILTQLPSRLPDPAHARYAGLQKYVLSLNAGISNGKLSLTGIACVPFFCVFHFQMRCIGGDDQNSDRFPCNRCKKANVQ